MKPVKYGPMPKNMTIGEKYGPAMEITDPDDAKEYFEACVQQTIMDEWNNSIKRIDRLLGIETVLVIIFVIITIANIVLSIAHG